MQDFKSGQPEWKSPNTRAGPLHIALTTPYPPTYQIMGTADWLFKLDQMTAFADLLTEQGVENRAVVVEGGVHGFDTGCVLGDAVDEEVVGPAVEWLSEFAV